MQSPLRGLRGDRVIALPLFFSNKKQTRSSNCFKTIIHIIHDLGLVQKERFLQSPCWNPAREMVTLHFGIKRQKGFSKPTGLLLKNNECLWPVASPNHFSGKNRNIWTQLLYGSYHLGNISFYSQQSSSSSRYWCKEMTVTFLGCRHVPSTQLLQGTPLFLSLCHPTGCCDGTVPAEGMKAGQDTQQKAAPARTRHCLPPAQCHQGCRAGSFLPCRRMHMSKKDLLFQQHRSLNRK